MQIQILLRIASELTEYAPSFPPDTDATLKLLRKLDHCFSSLATGRDLATGEALPGFEAGLNAGMTTTDLVRARSTVENTRALMFNLLSEDRDAVTEVDEDEDGEGAETPSVPSTPRTGGRNTDVDRIYENTIVAIGERFGGVMG